MLTRNGVYIQTTDFVDFMFSNLGCSCQEEQQRRRKEARKRQTETELKRRREAEYAGSGITTGRWRVVFQSTWWGRQSYAV